MNLSPRERTMIVVAAYALAFFCFVWFLYLPLQSRTADLQADNQQLIQEKTRLEAIRKKQEQQTPVSEGSELTAVNQQLPAQEELIPVLKYLNESSKKCGVELGSLEYRGSKESDGEEARILTFAVETSGSIFDLIDFLQQLLEAPRFISVADVSLSACKAENTSDSNESTPTYYIAPPGIPQAKLERVKIEIEEPDSEPDKRVADSFIPDQFDMKVTINAYYSPEDPDQAAESNTAETDAADDTAPETGEETGDDDSEGRI